MKKEILLEEVIGSKRYYFNDGFIIDCYKERMMTYKSFAYDISEQYSVYDDSVLKSIFSSLALLRKTEEDPVLYFGRKYKCNFKDCEKPKIFKYYDNIFDKDDLLKLLVYMWQYRELSLTIVGKTRNGKSLLGNFIAKAFGEFTVYLNLSDMNNIFNLAELSGKLFCYGDDLGYINNKDTAGQFKSIITNNKTLLQKKGKDPIEVQNRCIYWSNSNIPIALGMKLNDSGNASRIGTLKCGHQRFTAERSEVTQLLKEWYTEEEYIKFLRYLCSAPMLDPEDNFHDKYRVHTFADHPIVSWGLTNYDKYIQATNQPNSGLKAFNALTKAEFLEFWENYKYYRGRYDRYLDRNKIPTLLERVGENEDAKILS